MGTSTAFSSTLTVEEAFNGPATWSWAPTDDEAFEMNPPVRVERPNTPSVPDALTLPEESTKNLPRLKPVEVATANVPAVSVEVVVPSVTWKILGVARRPLNDAPLQPVQESTVRVASVVAPKTRSVPDALTLPEESTKNRPWSKVLAVWLMVRVVPSRSEVEPILKVPLA